MKSDGALFTPDKITYRGVMALFAVWLCGGLLIYLPNNGGSGLDFPFNIISWVMAALVSLWLTIRLPPRALYPVSSVPAMRPALAGAILWSLPLLWTPMLSDMEDSLPHVFALWGLLGLLWLLRRLPLNRQQQRGILLTIAAAGLLQAIFGFSQLTLMNGRGSLDGIHPFIYHRPFGIFQQANVLGSFVASGFFCLIVCRIRGFVAQLALFFMAFMLVLIQSRTAWLAEVLGIAILAATARSQPGGIRSLLPSFRAVAAGTALGILLLQGGLNTALRQLQPYGALSMLMDNLTVVKKSGSTLERLAILKTTAQLIAQHPLFGSGYGTFEAAFIQQARLDGGPFVSATLTHPHNELLYAWAEGGLAALVGLLLMVAACLRSLWLRGGWRWPGLVLLLPLSAHINLEYPLYLSVPHGLVLVLLLRVVMGPASPAPLSVPAEGGLRLLSDVAVRIAAILISIIVLAGMAAALQTQQRLTTIERQGLASLLPTRAQSTIAALWDRFGQARRIDYDRHVALLLDYNLSHSDADLTAFIVWAEEYLARHNDANVYESVLKIYSVRYPWYAKNICRRAHQMWPGDPRFRCTE